MELQQQQKKSQQSNNTTNIDIDNNDISMEDSSDINQPSCSSTTEHLMSFDKSEDL